MIAEVELRSHMFEICGISLDGVEMQGGAIFQTGSNLKLHGRTRPGDASDAQGQSVVLRSEAAPKAQDMTCRKTKFKHYVDEFQKKKNRSKSSMRAKVEHPFRILKRAFGFDKVRYRDLAKNHHRLCANFALVNLYMHRKRPAVLGQNCVRRQGNRLRNESNSSQNQPILPLFPRHSMQSGNQAPAQRFPQDVPNVIVRVSIIRAPLVESRKPGNAPSRGLISWQWMLMI